MTPMDKNFEALRQLNTHNKEFWSARDLMAVLGYENWRRFVNAISKAMISCQESENIVDYHFVGADKMIALPKGAERAVQDYHLSRFACYLIVQNADPRKPEIAYAQQYFAIQTRRQELSDQHLADKERLDLRHQTREEFKALSSTAQEVGVQTKMFGVFHDAGYKGLYGGLGNKAIKQRKNVPEKDNLMDYMDRTELAANQFRMTQTREKLKRDGIASQQAAIATHETVGQEVRRAIANIGGIMPEHLQPADHIKVVEKRLEHGVPKLLLDATVAKGLMED